MPTFIERHADKIRGVLSCFDRVVLTGTLPDLCHAEAMARYLGARNIRLFDYPRWAEPFRDEIRIHAEQVAQAHGLTIEFIRRGKAFRKEDRIKRLVAQRGDHPGLVHIFSAMEACPTYKPCIRDVASFSAFWYAPARDAMPSPPGCPGHPAPCDGAGDRADSHFPG